MRPRFRVRRQILLTITSGDWLIPYNLLMPQVPYLIWCYYEYQNILFVNGFAIVIDAININYNFGSDKYKHWNSSEVPKRFEISSRWWWEEGWNSEREWSPKTKEHHACVGILGTDLEKIPLAPVLIQGSLVIGYPYNMLYNVLWCSYNDCNQ